MAESTTKYMPVHNGFSSQSQDLHKFTNIFSFFNKTKKAKAFSYIFISIFLGFTVFLAVNPSPNPSSPWFSNIFTSTTLQPDTTTSSSSSSIRSHFSSIYSYLFNSTGSGSVTVNRGDRNVTHSEGEFTRSQGEVRSNQTTHSGGEFTRSQGEVRSNQTTQSEGEIGGQFRSNQSSVNTHSGGEKKGVNQTSVSEGVVGGKKSVNQTGAHNNTHREGEIKGVNGVNNITHSKGVVGENVKNSNQSIVGDFGSKQSSDTGNGAKSGPKSSENENDKKASVGKNDEDEMVKKLVKCDMFDGEWVKDESYPLYKPGSCSLIDEQFNCYNNGRPDKAFQMLKWKPKACTLPRLDGSKMLQMLRGKRLVFVGDSLNRNMWESLICILKNSVKDQTKVYEASGRHHFRSEPSYSFIFKDYNCTVEFFVAPFIVRESETKDKNGAKKETLRLDLVGTSAEQYKQADIIVFNTGHWWTHEKTAKGKDYYQEGSHVYNELNVLEAFRKAMTTWGRWVDAHIDPSKTLVFFRGYSASHFRGGQWNSGGQCDNEVEPIKNTTYLSPYPDKMKTLEKVLRGMKTRVSYLNITRLTDFRKDGHPSIYRKKHYSEVERRSPLHFQDCSHWCLPGVPDSWNEILYAELLAKQYQNQQQNN